MRLLAALIFPVAAAAQVSSSSLGGLVQGAAGDPVAGAAVSVEHEATRFSRSTRTGEAGVYLAEKLLPGSYTVRVAASGFRTTTVSGIDLAVGQAGRLDFQLEPGAASESVTVTAAVSPLETRSAAVGYRVEASSVRMLPLAARNVFSLLTLGPGAIPRHLGGFVHDEVTDIEPARGAVALNPPVHGARPTMNAFLLDGVVNTDRHAFATAVTPPLESVLEFRSHSVLAPAEFPQAGGAVIDVVSRTGSRDWHGSLFDFSRNEFADARNFFDDPALPALVFRRHQFGGSLGGPLPGPRTYFFATYEGLRGLSAKSSLNRVPEPSPRNGDFSAGPPLFDPLSAQASGSRAPFAANRIPSPRIDPIARNFLDRFQPLPNRQAASNYLDATPSGFTDDHVSARIDHELARRGRLFARYTVNEERARIAASFPVLPARQDLRAQQAVLGWTTGANSWIGDTRLAFTRLRTFKLPENAFRNNVAAELGVADASTEPALFGLPFFLATNYNLVIDDPALPLTKRDNLWQLSQDFALLRGTHSLKFGFLGTRFHLNYQQSRLARGQYIYTGAFTQASPGSPSSGDPFADFLLGFPQVTSRSVGNTLAYLRQSLFAGYIKDEWRVSPALTLHAGLRYEYVTPYRESRNSLLNLDYSPLPAPPVLVRAARPVDPDRNNFSPRVGLAWRLPKLPTLGDWTFRAGYGVYFSPELATGVYDLIRNGVRNENNLTDGVRPVLTTRVGFPQTEVSGFPGYFGIDPGARTAYVQQWTGGLQRELPGQTLLELAYVGSKGSSLGRFRQFNTPLHAVTGANLAPRPGPLQQLRPFPRLGAIVQRQHNANSNYHGLQMRVEKRLAGRLGVLGSFVWSKAIDDADSILKGFFVSAGAQDERNLRLERGLSFHHTGRRLSAGILYLLPSPRAGKKLLGGWELSSIVTLQDGTPLNPFYFAADFANTGTPNRPDVVPGVPLRLPRGQRTADRFFNTAAFRDPRPFTFGNAGRNILPGPGNNTVDAALHRRFRLAESASLRLRVEAFNLFNHPNFGIPGPYPDFGPFFGRILSTGEPRRLQFGARVDW